MARALCRTLERLVHRTVAANVVRGFGGLLVAVGVALPWTVAGVGVGGPATEPVKPEATDKNREGNKQHKDDIPTVNDSFGSPNDWVDMAKDGDPWATAVLEALNEMRVGAYAVQRSGAVFKFQLVICADGRVSGVRKKQTTGDVQFDAAIVHALESLTLPKAPDNIAKQLAGKCKKIPYVFTWSGSSTFGKVN